MMEELCLACGVTGYMEFLVYCIQCKACARHRYCLDKIPENGREEILWYCEDCQPETSKLTSFDKRVPGKRQKRKKRKRRRQQFACLVVKQSSSATNNPISFSLFGSTKVARSSACLLDTEVQNTCHLTLGDKQYKRPRRRLILPDEDEFELDSLFAEKSSREINESKKSGNSCNDTETSEYLSGRSDDDIKFKRRRRRLIIEDDEDLDGSVGQASIQEAHTGPLNSSCHQRYHQQCAYSPARPVLHVAWRGYFNICGAKYGPITAHLSDKASERVCNGVKFFPQVLKIEKVPKSVAWPKSFIVSPPTDDKIGLFFFPDSTFAGVEEALVQLVDDMVNEDIILKVTFDHFELLMFLSVILPANFHRFQGKLYLWGAFRRRQVPLPKLEWHAEQIQELEVTEAREEKIQMHVHNEGSANVSHTNEGLQISEIGALSLSLDCGGSASASPGSEVSQITDVGTFSQGLELPSRQVPDFTIRSKCQYKLSKLEAAKEEGEISDTDDGEQKHARKEGRMFKCEEEREEGEIWDESFHGEYNYLELFPLGAEDIAVTSRSWEPNELDLKLRLGWSNGNGVGNRDCHGESKAMDFISVS